MNSKWSRARDEEEKKQQLANKQQTVPAVCAVCWHPAREGRHRDCHSVANMNWTHRSSMVLRSDVCSDTHAPILFVYYCILQLHVFFFFYRFILNFVRTRCVCFYELFHCCRYSAFGTHAFSFYCPKSNRKKFVVFEVVVGFLLLVRLRLLSHESSNKKTRIKVSVGRIEGKSTIEINCCRMVVACSVRQTVCVCTCPFAVTRSRILLTNWNKSPVRCWLFSLSIRPGMKSEWNKSINSYFLASVSRTMTNAFVKISMCTANFSSFRFYLRYAFFDISLSASVRLTFLLCAPRTRDERIEQA